MVMTPGYPALGWVDPGRLGPDETARPRAPRPGRRGGGLRHDTGRDDARRPDKTRIGDPERCIATGEVHTEDRSLIRFVVGPDGVVPDVAASCRAGASGWRRIATRLQTGGQEEAFRPLGQAAGRVCPRTCGPGRGQTRPARVELISLARKAGRRWRATRKVKDWLDKGRAAYLIQAARRVRAGQGETLARRRDRARRSGCLTASGIGFVLRTGTCDTCGARGWRTHPTCCRDAASAIGLRAQHRRYGRREGYEEYA